jgi:hypothetical protein
MIKAGGSVMRWVLEDHAAFVLRNDPPIGALAFEDECCASGFGWADVNLLRQEMIFLI